MVTPSGVWAVVQACSAERTAPVRRPCLYARDFGGGRVKAAVNGPAVEDGITEAPEGDTGMDVGRRREWVGAPVVNLNLFGCSSVGAEQDVSCSIAGPARSAAVTCGDGANRTGPRANRPLMSWISR